MRTNTIRTPDANRGDAHPTYGTGSPRSSQGVLSPSSVDLQQPRGCCPRVARSPSRGVGAAAPDGPWGRGKGGGVPSAGGARPRFARGVHNSDAHELPSCGAGRCSAVSGAAASGVRGAARNVIDVHSASGGDLWGVRGGCLWGLRGWFCPSGTTLKPPRAGAAGPKRPDQRRCESHLKAPPSKSSLADTFAPMPRRRTSSAARLACGWLGVLATDRRAGMAGSAVNVARGEPWSCGDLARVWRPGSGYVVAAA